MIKNEIEESIDESVLCWLATADSSGFPNVSPKEMFVKFGDDKILIANIASPETVKNIKVNSNVCLSFINVFTQKGFKLKGKAKIINKNDSLYEAYCEKLYVLGGRDFDIKSVIEVSVISSKAIIAPSYWAFPGTTKESMIEQSLKRYAVKK